MEPHIPRKILSSLNIFVFVIVGTMPFMCAQYLHCVCTNLQGLEVFIYSTENYGTSFGLKMEKRRKSLGRIKPLQVTGMVSSYNDKYLMVITT